MKACWYSLPIVVLTCSGLLAEAVGGPAFLDAFGNQTALHPPGQVTVLMGCAETTQRGCRAATRAVDHLRGRVGLRFVVLVDLRDSFGWILPAYVRRRIREDMKQEAVRLKPFYLENGNGGDPLRDMTAIPDFDGEACHAVGWREPLTAVAAVVYGRDGREIHRWDRLQDYFRFEEVVERALDDRGPQGSSFQRGGPVNGY
jgi:hypothetical protein